MSDPCCPQTYYVPLVQDCSGNTMTLPRNGILSTNRMMRANDIMFPEVLTKDVTFYVET
jgi:hypothetical protein